MSPRPAAVHGTRSRYSRGCRCPECREANRLYAEQRRRAQGMKPLRTWTEASHGTESRYHYGCSCAECRQANTVAAALRVERRNGPTKKRATRGWLAKRWPQYYGEQAS